MRFAFVLVSLLFTGAAIAAELPEMPSNDYGAARQALIADGWMPYRTADSDCVNNEETKRCVQYPEIRHCASGLAPCIMVWSRNGEFLTVHTLGERNPKVTKAVGGLIP